MIASVTDDDPAPDDETVTVVEITDELDLHTFRPSDLGELIPDYLDEAAARGFSEVRIIHGKGIGALRRSVHALLDRHPRVESYRLGDERSGAWGATLVRLKP
jgi:dsDNA-specific endonuclease/ATPase MutS2